MAVSKLSNSGIKTGVLKYDSMLAGNAPYDPAATWLISRVTTVGGETSITFTGIPSTYQHLQVRGRSRNNTGGATDSTAMRFRFNSDTGTNYTSHYLYGNGSSVLAGVDGTSNNAMRFPEFLGSGATANVQAISIIDVHDYANTSKNKTVRVFQGWDANGSGFILLNSGLWMSTSAVTSISLTPASGAFVAGCTYALYGMKG